MTNSAIRIIKKYPNRRLYDMTTSSYITIADVKKMIIEQNNIAVQDAKTGEDLTRQVLLQILLEEESGGTHLLSNEMLCQFIRVYGEAMHSVLGPFLAQNMQLFGNWQQNIQQQTKEIKDASSWLNPFVTSSIPASPQMFLKWQQDLQDQALQFWQTVGVAPQKTK